MNGTVWVTNRTLNTVAAFDAATGVLRGSAAVGRAPIGITVPPETGKVYVSNENANTVSVLSALDLTVRKTVDTGPRPHHLIHHPSGRFVYVAEFGSNQIGVIDSRTDTRVAGFSASASSAARTHAVWATPDGKLYAVNEGSNDLAALDATTGQLLWTLPVGNRPSEVLATPDGRRAYVSVRNEDKVKVVALATRAIVGEALVGTQPDTLQLTDDGRILVVALRGTPAQVVFLDTSTLSVTTVNAGGTTTGHEWLSADSRFTFVAIEGPGDLGSVAVIDNATRKLVAMYPYPGGGRPHGVYWEARPRSQEQRELPVRVRF